AQKYSSASSSSSKKSKGQFFTPPKIACFMAEMFDLNRLTQDRITLLDPGAGTGTLTAAFCRELMKSPGKVHLSIDAFENDSDLIPILEEVLKSCREKMEAQGHQVEFRIFDDDFVLSNEGIFGDACLFRETNGSKPCYDYVISNPPYYKLGKNSPQAVAMKHLVYGQPNIYSFFMAISAKLLKPGGEMVFITPRSFCSGLYYKSFREWFLKNIRMERIHVFESRKDLFSKDGVLQENIIFRGRRLGSEICRSDDPEGRLSVTVSHSNGLNDLKKLTPTPKDIVYQRNGAVFIRIPASERDLDVIHAIDAWPNHLKGLGWEISTGPVITFRAVEHLLPDVVEKPNSVPLIWMHNMKNMKVYWQERKNNKPRAIRENEYTRYLLLPSKNYVLLKRFTSKEQNRRLYASVLLKSEFPFEWVGIENHVNYIHLPGGELSVKEAFGLAALLNSKVVDDYFRSLNGNTQVNALDIRSLPMPGKKEVTQIGAAVLESGAFSHGSELDEIVNSILKIQI
ncbi:Eco57I restriction-modification methylase domain-containing protein, partial [bacterium]|nr:Eco57I restriction-modification methylase domain-containing protein [bacterium]